jgi:hypothetical protein
MATSGRAPIEKLPTLMALNVVSQEVVSIEVDP